MKPLPKTQERNKKMIADYEKVPRESMASIAKRYGVTRSYVHQVVHKHYADLQLKQLNEETTN